MLSCTSNFVTGLHVCVASVETNVGEIPAIVKEDIIATFDIK